MGFATSYANEKVDCVIIYKRANESYLMSHHSVGS